MGHPKYEFVVRVRDGSGTRIEVFRADTMSDVPIDGWTEFKHGDEVVGKVRGGLITDWEREPYRPPPVPPEQG